MASICWRAEFPVRLSRSPESSWELMTSETCFLRLFAWLRRSALRPSCWRMCVVSRLPALATIGSSSSRRSRLSATFRTGRYSRLVSMGFLSSGHVSYLSRSEAALLAGSDGLSPLVHLPRWATLSGILWPAVGGRVPLNGPPELTTSRPQSSGARISMAAQISVQPEPARTGAAWVSTV